MDGFCEQVVKVDRKKKDNILAVIYILLALGLPALCICIAYILNAYYNYGGYFAEIALFVLIATIPLAILLIKNQRTEFEYQVVDNYLLVDKIIDKRKRKKILRVKIDEFKSLDKFSDSNYSGRKINKFFVAVNDVEEEGVYAFSFYNEARGNCAVVMKPAKNILEGMRPKLMPELQIKALKLIRGAEI